MRGHGFRLAQKVATIGKVPVGSCEEKCAEKRDQPSDQRLRSRSDGHVEFVERSEGGSNEVHILGAEKNALHRANLT
jgi:hypothetical protein